MAEKSDTPKILEEISRSNTAAPKSSRNRSLVTALLIIVIVAAISGAGFIANEQLALQLRVDELIQENAALNQGLQSQADQVQALQQQLQQPPAAIEFDDSEIRNAIGEVESNIATELGNLREQLAGTRAQLAQANQQPTADWKLGEAQYLLGLANQKVQLEGDIRGGLLLLQQADAALLATDSSTALPVRQAIAAHLQDLRSIEIVDRDGIHLRIDAVAAQVEALNLLSTMRESFTGRRGDASAPVELSATEYGIVNATMEFLSSVFVWRRWEETPEAMLLPGQDALIKQSVVLMLEQAKLAVLRRDQALFQRSLAQATESLQRYEVTSTAAGRAVIEEISALGTLNIEPALPDFGETLALLSSLVSAQQ